MFGTGIGTYMPSASTSVTVIRAVARARLSILTIALTYAVFITLGIMFVHLRNASALAYRDKIVGDASRTEPAALARGQGHNLRAALLDFSANLTRGAVPMTVMGLAIVMPYPWVAYQGWIGGIVSVRGDHSSRLADWRPALYYLLTLVLQLIPYSLALGSGVNVGVSMFRPPAYYQGQKWIGLLPKEAVRDLLRTYVLVVPLFLVASLWEFLSPWNF